MVALLAVTLLLTTMGTVFAQTQASQKSPRFKTNIIHQTGKFTPQTKATVLLDELKQGCPSRDCIPSIYKPKFASVAATLFINQDEPVVVDYRGPQKISPRNIMERHEIVNDWFGRVPGRTTPMRRF